MTDTQSTTGRDWLEMSRAHFDASLLPRKHRRPEAEGLFAVADVAPAGPKPARPAGPQLEGQGDMFAPEE